LRERTTRVEEKLKHQRELMLMNFAQIEKHIEQVDRQLKQMRSDFEKRFEKIEK